MKALICPRCDSSEALKIGDSPVKDKFEIYRCPSCNYVWRSTEDLSDIAKWIDYWRKNVSTEMMEQ